MRKKDFSFAQVPTIKARRSQFDLSQDIKTSGNVGTLYPFYCQEVYPGDTFKVKCTSVSRVSSAFVKPVMDNLFQDVYFFFVPSRLVYDKWAEVFGENKLSAWAQSAPVDVPGMATSGSVNGAYSSTPSAASVGGYLGLPVGQAISPTVVPEISVLPFRAFAKIYDDWFRDENNIDPMNIIVGATGQGEYLNDSAWSPSNYFGRCPKVAKFHDYFTSSLPAPQKGDPVEIGSAVIPERILPVATLPIAGSQNQGSVTTSTELFPSDLSKLTSLMSDAGYEKLIANQGRGLLLSSNPALWNPPSNSIKYLIRSSSTAGVNNSLAGVVSEESASQGNPLYPSNLAAYDPGSSLGSVSVNDLRLAFQTQKMLEKDARSGSRYTSYIEGHFGVHSPDARLQRSEFLGGKRTPINIYQVAQTSQSGADGENPLGGLGAYSHSVGRSRFTKGFVEHGYVIGVMCMRYHHTYSQGVERFWTRRHRLDFYDPVFANIGEQPVYKRELYAGAGFDEVFGYNEAWADMRYRPSRVSGQMSPFASPNFQVYHFADEYTNAPVLSETFINEDPSFVDRTLAVDSSLSDQFVFDILVENTAIRELPVYSVPSLIDHH